MFNELHRTAASIIGAILLSTASIAAAVGPGVAQPAAAQQAPDRA